MGATVFEPLLRIIWINVHGLCDMDKHVSDCCSSYCGNITRYNECRSRYSGLQNRLRLEPTSSNCQGSTRTTFQNMPTWVGCCDVAHQSPGLKDVIVKKGCTR